MLCCQQYYRPPGPYWGWGALTMGITAFLGLDFAPWFDQTRKRESQGLGSTAW
jgi:hypothetical protein